MVSAYLTLTFIIKSEDKVVVPDLVGKDVVLILEMLSDLGLNTKIKGSEYSDNVPKNHVIFQEPEPGSEIKKRRDIRIIISKGTKRILMPNLKGLSIQQARLIIEENGLSLNKLSSTYSENVKKNEIISQFPSPGRMIARGGFLNLLVSTGIRQNAYKMPDIKGQSLEEAIALIESFNLLLGEIKFLFIEEKPENIIIDQVPLSGHKVIEGTYVNITLNREAGRKGQKHLNSTKGVSLFKYRLNYGFLKKHIRLRLNSFGISNDIFDSFMKPGEEIWSLIPGNKDATVLLYEDDKLIKTEVFDSWQN
ncbi:MAG: PASTA domain-containing protein [Proteobacteria bacterium]|nr:PASTA domain-containing protein [Pseudomonadota bacterium]